MTKKPYARDLMKEMGLSGPLPQHIVPNSCFCPHCGKELDISFDVNIKLKVQRIVAFPKGTIKGGTVVGR